MSRKCHLDIETYSECDLKREGLYRYAEHPSTELLVVCYAFDDEPVQTWVPSDDPFVPDDLRAHFLVNGEVRAHNAQFERVVLNGVAGQKVDFPRLEIKQMVCTAAKMAAHGLPRALGDAASALGTHPKNDIGRMDMLQLSKPRTGKVARWTPENAPERFDRLYQYCVDDVEAERGIDRVVPDLSAAEQRVYELDQLINERGIAVDLKAVEDAQVLIAEYKTELHARCREWTGLNPSQSAKLADWVRANGYPQLTDLQADTVKHAVRDATCPPDVVNVLRLYSTYNAKAVSKYEAIERSVCEDGRLHGMFLYHGANTGRWSSLIVQLQNLFRPVIDNPEEAVDCFASRDLDWLRALYPEHDPMKVLASCVRAMLVAGEGKTLQSLDFSGIESRMTAWLFDEEWKLDAFRDFDAGTGEDLYKIAYARAFRVRMDDIDKNKRQIGKVCLSGKTLVLCERGWVPLAAVRGEDKVWDGETWVRHSGAVCNGWRPVVNLCGVLLTPDHLVWCGSTWLRADSLVASQESLYLALASAAENLPSQGMCGPRRAKVSTASSSSAIVRQKNTWWSRITSKLSRAHDAMCARSRRRGKSDSGFTQRQCRTTSTAAAFSTDWQQPSRDATLQGPSSEPRTGVEGSPFATSGGKIAPRFFATFKRLKDGTTRALKWIEPTITPGTPREISASLRSGRTTRIDGLWPCSKQIVPVYDLLSCGSKHRFTVWSDRGPLLVHNCELALGYEGGASAFATMAANYGVDLAEMASRVRQALSQDVVESAEWMWAKFGSKSELPHDVFIACDGLKQLWRAAHPRIRQGWADLRDAAKLAVENPGKMYAIPSGKLKLRVKDQWLQMRLPSGRCLHYFRPEVDEDGKVTYMGVDTYTRRWMRTGTYGGKLTENAAQAASRDLLVNALFNFEAAGIPTGGTVHDEIISEVAGGSLDAARALMCQLPAWAAGLPVAAEGWRAKRYRK